MMQYILLLNRLKRSFVVSFKSANIFQVFLVFSLKSVLYETINDYDEKLKCFKRVNDFFSKKLFLRLESRCVF